MLHSLEKSLQEVHAHFKANDYSLAHRRMLDCAMETRNPEIFRAALNHYEWLESSQEANPETIYQKAVPLLERIASAGVKNEDRNGNTVLTVSNLKKTYRQSKFQINDLSFHLNFGEIIGLVGENGNGKTTLLRLVAGELKPDQGIIDYNFIDKYRDRYDIRTRLAYVEQRIPRWYGNLMDNLQFTLSHYGITGDENVLWAEMMVARLGLRPYRHLNWNRISSGYRTRFELAKTLLRRPEILLLDEPLANLDIISQQTILQDLKFMASSTSAPFGMLLSSQHIYEVEKVSDRIIFLEKGNPRYQGPLAGDDTNITSPLILEIETEASREEITALLGTLRLDKLQFNGGVYVLTFAEGTSSAQVLKAFADSSIELGYYRNISRSSRRFFIQA